MSTAREQRSPWADPTGAAVTVISCLLLSRRRPFGAIQRRRRSRALVPDMRRLSRRSGARVALGGALQQHGTFGDVPGGRGRAAELGGRPTVPAEPRPQTPAGAGQVVGPAEPR